MTGSAAADFELDFPRPYIARIRIGTRPLGILTTAHRRQLLRLIREQTGDRHVRALILTGRGRAFCAGSDIKEFEASASWLNQALEVETELNETLERAPVAVIAACNGATLGGGLVMAMACDIRIASSDATFGVPEVRIGAFPTASGTQRLAAQLGRGRALQLILTGDIVDAARAEAIGLVEKVVEPNTLPGSTIEMAERIAAASPVAIAAAKACVNAGVREGWPAGLAMERRLTAPVGLSDDAKEGKTAFMEKRAPSFPGGRVEPASPAGDV